jgi:hypothetical protein
VHNDKSPCEGNLQENAIIEPIEEEISIADKIVQKEPPLTELIKATLATTPSSLAKSNHEE